MCTDCFLKDFFSLAAFFAQKNIFGELLFFYVECNDRMEKVKSSGNGIFVVTVHGVRVENDP